MSRQDSARDQCGQSAWKGSSAIASSDASTPACGAAVNGGSASSALAALYGHPPSLSGPPSSLEEVAATVTVATSPGK